MKRIIGFIFSVFPILFLQSCRKDVGDVQMIDQMMQIYVDSAGTDMLNKNLPNSYISVSWNDVNGITDNVPVSFSLEVDGESKYYMKYLAGAKRVLMDSIDAGNKKYRSDIALRYTKKINDSVNHIINDTMHIHYTYTPSIFSIEKVFYNSQQVFSKVVGSPNVVKIHK